jgi:hypothetical protein
MRRAVKSAEHAPRADTAERRELLEHIRQEITADRHAAGRTLSLR